VIKDAFELYSGCSFGAVFSLAAMSLLPLFLTRKNSDKGSKSLLINGSPERLFSLENLALLRKSTYFEVLHTEPVVHRQLLLGITPAWQFGYRHFAVSTMHAAAPEQESLRFSFFDRLQK